ncbi:MAG TPA: hypothetical protein VM408_02475 [Methylomirabilota bacterium]|nr:hypothetical protein [Methylomirabilota bacterium]
MTPDRHARPVRLVLALLAAAALASGCGTAAPPVVGDTFPPAAPTRTVDAAKVIAGLKAALGPDNPLRVKATTASRAGGVDAFILEGVMQGGEMDAHASYRIGNLQLSFDVIAADGKAYVRPFKGKWAKSPEKVPPKASGPFGDMGKAKLTFGGVSKSDRDLYIVNWEKPTHAARALLGTVFSSLKIKSMAMQFVVDENGKPYTATYQLKGTARVEKREAYPLDITGYYQFFSIREPLEVTSPLK